MCLVSHRKIHGWKSKVWIFRVNLWFHIEKYMDGNLKFGFLELICDFQTKNYPKKRAILSNNMIK